MLRTISVALAVAGMFLSGCSTAKQTHTSRTAKEQLLISHSIDQALDKVDLSPFRGHAVIVEAQHLDCVDKGYVLASLRHRALMSGATLVESRDKAEVVLEVRSGGVGTDSTDMFIGTPELAVPGPLPISLPEVRLLSRTEQSGTAKIGIAAYDAKSGTPLGLGGMTVAQSDDRNWYVFGAGPWKSGSIQTEMNESLRPQPAHNTVPHHVAFAAPSSTAAEPEAARVRLASEESNGAAAPEAEAGRVPWAE